MRKFLTLDGDVLEESDWGINPIDKCFYCDLPLTYTETFRSCGGSLDGGHDWITLVNPSEFRR